jgi:hypothetical protein
MRRRAAAVAGELVEVPGPFRSAGALPAGVFGQRRQQPQPAGVGAGEVVLPDVTGVGEHGTQLRADASLGWLLAAGVQQRGSRVRSTGCWDTIAPTMTCCTVTTSWPLDPAT